MKYKKIMLVAFVLLAILTIGAVSASDSSDSNSLTVDNGGVDDSIASPVNDVDLLSYDGDDESNPYVGDANGTSTNDDVTPVDNGADPEEDNEGDNDGEESFEVWVDDDPQGFDVSSSDLSGYFIGSLTVPENMNGNISIITENDDILFNKNLNDFDSKLIRDNNTYDFTLSDNGGYIFEGVEDGTVFRFAFLDDEGSEIWGSSNYKLVIENNTIWLKKLTELDDEGNPDDEFDPTKFSIDRRDDENNVLALNVPVFSLYCPDGSEGTVDVTVSYNGNDYSVSRNISDMDENNFIHWYLSDLNMTLLVKYEISVDVNDGEFESHFDAYVHEPILFVNEKSYINTFYKDSFVCFEVPSEYGDATVIVEVDDMIFNKTLAEFKHADDTNDDYYWFHPSYGPGPGDERFKHYVVYNGIFNGLEAKTYNVTARLILVNSPVGNRTFIYSGKIDVLDGGIVENKGVAMEVDHQGRYGIGNEYECLISISVPDGANGKVTVTLDGNVIFENNLDQLDKEDEYYVVRPSNLELDEGEYDLTFAYFEDDEKIVETNGTFSFIRYGDEGDDADDGVVIWVNEGDVKEFDLNNDDDLNGAFAYLSLSNDLDGTIVLYCFNEEDGDVQDFFHIDLTNVSNNYPDEERDGFTIYELSFNSLGDQFDILKKVGWFKIAFVSNYGEDESREVDSREYNIDYDDEANVIKFWQAGDDADDGVVIWVNEGDVKEFDLNNDEDLDSAFAYLSLSNDLDGTVVLYCFSEEEDEEQDFFHIDIADLTNKYSDEERDGFTIYELSFNSLGGQFDILKDVSWFKIAFVTNYGEDESREVDFREYNIEFDDDANVIRFWQASGGEDDETFDEIELNFIDDDDELIFERTNNTHVANLLIPDLEEFEGTVVNITVRKNGKVVQSISTSDIEHENLPAAHRYPICIDLTKFDDMDAMDIQVDCFDNDSRLWEFTVEVKGDTVILHSAPEEDYYVFYGNITTRDLNRPDLMGPHPNDRFFSTTIPDSNITEGTVVVSYGESVIEYSFANCSHDKYENIYWVNLDDFDLMTLPENEIITFTFSYADKSLTFKRIRQGDYLYVVLTPDDFDWKGWNNFKFEISDEAYGDDGSVGRIIGNSNMQSIYIEFNGGYFDVYVNDTKIEGLNTVLSLENLRNSIDDGGVDLTFSMLNITKSGQYNIKIVHVQSANEDEGEYFYVAETELVNKNILVDFGDIEENSTVEIGDIEFTYNQTGSTKVTLTGASDIIASVVDHDEAKVTFSDGKLTVSGLDAGEYKLNVTTVPDEGFTATTKLVNITVNKADVNLTVEVNNTSVGQNAIVHIRAYGWFGSAVTIKYDGKYYTAIVVSGGALYEILVEKPGLQTVTVQFEGDNNYNAAQANATFNVAKLTPEIVITSGEAIEGSDLDVTVEVNDDATGSVTVNGANVTLKDGKAITTIKNLVAGDLNITVLYSGDDRYVNASESRKVTVKAKMDAGLTVSADNIEAGQIAVVSIEINANVTGKVTVNGNEVEIINGKGSYNLSDLNAGEHNVTVVFEGDKYFKADEKTASFIVSKSTPTIEITVGEAIEGSDLKVTVTIEDATGNVTVNGNTVALANGEAIATIENLAAGELNVTAVYSGDDRYVNASESRKVSVKAKMDAGLKVSADNIEAGQIAVVNIEINANVTGKVTVNGNVVDIIDGKGSYNLSDLNAGEHNVAVVFEGDKYFNADEKTASFNVTAKSLPVDPALTIRVNDIYEGANAVISITTNATFSGKVLVQIGNKNYTVAVTNGAGSLSVSGLAIGTHTAIATLPAASPFDSSTKSTTFAVNAKVKTSITASAVKTTYATSKKLVVTLKDANGNLLKGQKVIVVLNKVERTLTTNNKGQAKLAIGTKLLPNKYTASITFNGDAKYAKSTKSVKVVVNKAKPKLTASKKTFKVKNPKKYTIALKTDKGKALNKAKVTLTVKVKGKTVKITGTTKNGKATFNLNMLSKNGKYTAKVKFAGNKYYKAVTKKAIITVN